MNQTEIYAGPGENGTFVLDVTEPHGLNTQCVWKKTQDGMAFAKHRMDKPGAHSHTVFAGLQPVFEWTGPDDFESVKAQVDAVKLGSPSWVLTLAANYERLGGDPAKKPAILAALAETYLDADFGAVRKWGEWAAYSAPVPQKDDREFVPCIISLIESEPCFLRNEAMSEFAKKIGADLESCEAFNELGKILADLTPDEKREVRKLAKTLLQPGSRRRSKK